jgi:uncharacterized protein (TIGR02466 family)
MTPFYLFPTPVCSFINPDHDVMVDDLMTKLAAQRGIDAGISRSNQLGWHSSNLEYKPYKVLVDWVTKCLAETLTELGYINTKFALANFWVVVSPPGASNAQHTHPGAMYSGAYYLKTPGPASPLLFHDPRGARAFTELQDKMRGPTLAVIRALPVQAGQLVLFPSWLAHSVPVNEAAEDRVVLSFNYIRLPDS